MIGKHAQPDSSALKVLSPAQERRQTEISRLANDFERYATSKGFDKESERCKEFVSALGNGLGKLLGSGDAGFEYRVFDAYLVLNDKEAKKMIDPEFIDALFTREIAEKVLFFVSTRLAVPSNVKEVATRYDINQILLKGSYVTS